jgi:hypothetical protein
MNDHYILTPGTGGPGSVPNLAVIDGTHFQLKLQTLPNSDVIDYSTIDLPSSFFNSLGSIYGTIASVFGLILFIYRRYILKLNSDAAAASSISKIAKTSSV